MMLAALPLLGQLSNLDFDANPDFKRHGVIRAGLLSAKVQSATIEITQPASADFTWLDELQLVAKAGDAETVFADELDISGRLPPASNPLNLSLTAMNDVTAQVAQTPMSFLMRGKGRQPTSDTQVQLTLTLGIQATPSKQ
jgi:hypothetical protein